MEFHWEVEKYWEMGSFDFEEVLEYGNDKVAEQPICFDTSKKSLLEYIGYIKLSLVPFSNRTMDIAEEINVASLVGVGVVDK